MYLYRLLSFFNHRRQNTESIKFMRLMAAWMDLMPVHTAMSPEFRASVQDANARRSRRCQPRLQIRCQETIQKYSGSTSTACRNVFEKHLPQELHHEMTKTQYHDLFVTTRTSIQDPSIRPPGRNRSNTFYILEQAEYEGEEGFWVEDEDGAEGFMANNDEETF